MKTVMKIFILLLLATPVFSANTWTGAGANNLWTNTSNWSGGYPDTTNQLKLQGNNEILEVVSGNVILFNRAVFIDGTSVAGGLDNPTTTINMTGGSLHVQLLSELAILVLQAPVRQKARY
jgi:hypothetical protein